MRFLSNYLNFIFESVTKQEMRLYFSDEFRNILRRIQDKSSIAQALLSSEDSNQILDIYTLIDITEKNDTISLIQVNRITRGNPELGETLPYNIRDKKRGSEFWTKARTEIGIGRWARRIFIEVHKSTILESKIEEQETKKPAQAKKQKPIISFNEDTIIKFISDAGLGYAIKRYVTNLRKGTKVVSAEGWKYVPLLNLAQIKKTDIRKVQSGYSKYINKKK